MQNKTKRAFSNPFKDINAFCTYMAIGMCVLAVVTYIISVFKSSIHVDSAYYINTTKLLIQGKQPFRDFALGYTPLTFYLNYYPFKLYGDIYPCIIGIIFGAVP